MTNKLIRTFLAVPIPEKVKKTITCFQDELRNYSENIRWVRADNMHLTLKFLGEIPVDQATLIPAFLEPLIEKIAEFKVSICSTGAFPNRKRPTILWVGVKEGYTEISDLALQIETIFTEQGYKRENRRYTPHLTIGRIKLLGNTEPLMQKMLKGFTSESFLVSEVHMIESILRPTGAVYKTLNSLKLKG